MQNGPDFDKFIEPFIKIYQNVEFDLIKHIASHFKLYEDIGFKNSMEWYVKKIAERGALTQEAIHIISKETKISKEKIIEMLKEVGISTIDFDVIDKLNNSRDFKIDIPTLINSDSFLNIVDNSYKEIDGIFKLINTKALEGTNQAYMNVLNEAYVSVKGGEFDYNTAIRKALIKMANQGVIVASYKQKNGKILNYGIESCVRRDILTAVVQCTNKASENFAKEMNAEYYEVSQHLGARVTDTHDYKDHYWWQGKVYKIDGSTKDYPNFQETCNEGDIQGIGGANCRHIKWAYWPGVSVPKRIDISEEENKKIYELSQMQRNYERTIRDYKRQIETAKSSNDDEKLDIYKKKIKSIDKEYNDFCKENNLKRKYAREGIISNSSTYTKSENDALTKYVSPDAISLNEKLRSNLSLTKSEQEWVQNLDSALAKTPNYNGLVIRDLELKNVQDFMKDININQEYSTNQYLSFSTGKRFNENANVKIYIEKSKTAKDITKINTIGEQEVLYERNKRFKTLNVQKRNGIIYILWEETE